MVKIVNLTPNPITIPTTNGNIEIPVSGWELRLSEYKGRFGSPIFEKSEGSGDFEKPDLRDKTNLLVVPQNVLNWIKRNPNNITNKENYVSPAELTGLKRKIV